MDIMLSIVGTIVGTILGTIVGTIVGITRKGMNQTRSYIPIFHLNHPV